MNSPKKYVVSKTLQQPTSRNTTIIRDNVIESVCALKEQPGKNILTDGSSQLVHAPAGERLCRRAASARVSADIGEREACAAEWCACDIRPNVGNTVSRRRSGLAPYASALDSSPASRFPDSPAGGTLRLRTPLARRRAELINHAIGHGVERIPVGIQHKVL